MNPIELTKLGADLKRRVKPKHTMYADDVDLQLIADYKTEIVVYNNVYEKDGGLYTCP